MWLHGTSPQIPLESFWKIPGFFPLFFKTGSALLKQVLFASCRCSSGVPFKQDKSNLPSSKRVLGAPPLPNMLPAVGHDKAQANKV